MSIRQFFTLLASSLFLMVSNPPLLAQTPIRFDPPPGDGSPGKTRGAGSRDDKQCSQDRPQSLASASTAQVSLSALVPVSHSGITWSERPIFWVYIPKTSARQIVLSIKEKGAKSHSQQFVSITGAPGIVGVPLAEDAAPLSIGKTYQWAVVLICGKRPNPNDPVVTAWISRQKVGQSLDALSVTKKAAQYSEQGVWYDALTTLAQARQSQPQDESLKQLCIKFLKQPTVELDAIADQ